MSRPAPVASFHLSTFDTVGALRRLVGVPVDRRRLRAVPGLRFGKLLGTASGTTMTASADLRRWAIFAVWDDHAALTRFRTEHALGRAFAESAESFQVVLDPLGARGTWNGIDPTDGARAAPAGGDEAGTVDGPVAVLTRATVRWRRIPAFLASVPAVDARLAEADGLLATVGIGEAPIGRQATFSLWRDRDAVRRFAYTSDEHVEVIRRTRDEAWYGEEWFARFSPLAWSGTWSGRRPLG